MIRVNKVLLASAGTGKTHQLTNQYIRLLVAGVEPDAILATTFTRKAAAEILDRVLSRLAKAAASDGDASELAKQIGEPKTTRRQFTQCLIHVLRSMHRMRIGTIDSFNMDLAGSFGFELNLPPAWSICEEVEDEAICREAIESLLDREPENIAQLLLMINRGAPGRSIHKDLKHTIDKLYAVFRASEQTAWEGLRVPRTPSGGAVSDALEKLDAVEFRDKVAAKAKAKELDAFRRQDWEDFLGSGIPAVILKGGGKYNRTELSADVEAMYQPLIEHAKAQVIQELADQSKACRDFLARFDAEVWSLRRRYGALRFDDVTHTLAAAMRTQTLAGDGLGYRLDGPCKHLLLDEFQDTALSQWRAVAPLVNGKERRSFFCVGDKKQAIYRWRGGMSEIFDLVGPHTDTLRESQRSDTAIIDLMNQVFTNLTRFDHDKCNPALEAWQSRFEEHTTVKTDEGYVCVHSGPAQAEGERIVEQRERHYPYVADRICELAQQTADLTIGVLCRTNDTLARMMFELRRRQVKASEEGGNTLTDSAAVELILSLLILADHPQHGVARFHLENSPLKQHLRTDNPLLLSAQLRAELFTKGYGRFVHDWAKLLAPACDERDQRRLQQLVEVAYDYQSQSTLRADDFVTIVRKQRVPDPTDAKVRVMTIHTAKGLQFDVVVLPEVDEILTGQQPYYVTRIDNKSLEIKAVCRYVRDKLQAVLDPEDRQMFEDDSRRRVEDSLCLLYVAMTRAKHALYIYVPGPRLSGRKDRWHNLLLACLQIENNYKEKSLLYESEVAARFHGAVKPGHVENAPPQALTEIKFSAEATNQRRGLEHVAPSRREGDARVPLARVFNRSERQRTASGILYHAWFALIGWLDEDVPSRKALRAAAEKIRSDLPPEIWTNIDQRMAGFQEIIQKPDIAAVLRRSAYDGSDAIGFPSALAGLWTPMLRPMGVERERKFIVREQDKFCTGSVDRLVWLADGSKVQAADIIDFKTDDIPTGDEAALAKRVDHYRPQLEAYRAAVARLGGLALEHIAARLVFTVPGRVVEVCEQSRPQGLLF